MKKSKFLGTVLLAIFLLQSCGMYDLRSSDIKKDGVSEIQTQKGKMLLEKAWKKQGFDKLKDFKTYAFHGKDSWKGLFGQVGKVWADKKLEIDFKYRIGTFDGQVTFLDGKEKGKTTGLQNWNYYEIEKGKTNFSDKDLKENQRKVFGIAAYQYFTEMVDRFRTAPIIAYAGEKEFRSQAYDLVFCTWSTPKPHIEHDQYVAWINKKTGYMDFAEYTIRDTYLKPPGYKSIGGAVEFRDFRNINGVMIPHEQIVYAVKMGKNPKKNLHRLLISDFQFDSFDETELQVDKALPLGTKSKN